MYTGLGSGTGAFIILADGSASEQFVDSDYRRIGDVEARAEYLTAENNPTGRRPLYVVKTKTRLYLATAGGIWARDL